MDALAVIQEISQRTSENSKIQRALEDAAHLIGEGANSLDELLREVCSDASSGLREPCLHIIEAGGKRIRPAVCLLAFRTVNETDTLPLDLAASCELLHNATLLHDDVIDDGELRRGRPSAKTVYGNAVSVLAGDYLLVRTVELVAARAPKYMDAFVQTLRHLIEGELVQLSRRGSVETTKEEYFQIIEGKTASLFYWAAYSGALAAGSDTTFCQQFGQYGWHVGLAFQLIDDVLDLSADPSQLGKNLLTDIREGKMTLPVILAAQKSQTICGLLNQLLDGGDPSAVAPQIAERVRASGAVESTREKAAFHTNEALAILNGFGQVNERALMVLKELSTALLDRSF